MMPEYVLLSYSKTKRMASFLILHLQNWTYYVSGIRFEINTNRYTRVTNCFWSCITQVNISKTSLSILEKHQEGHF